jgi:catechol 2,3-dioxygenase-like lactoylglutathione lyase family enzyme
VTLAGSPPVACLATTDLRRAQDFFTGTLGLPLLLEDGFACVFEAGPVSLRVSLVQDLTPAPYTVLGWTVEDIVQSIDQLRNAGVTFEQFDWLEQTHHGVWAAPGGALVAWFKDPDGNLLSLTQPR